MKKLLLILMIATTMIAMATCIFCKKKTCAITEDPVGDIKDINVEGMECGENICRRLLIK